VTITPELLRLYASAPTQVEMRETLELAHPLFAVSHYLTNSPQGFAANLETGELVTWRSAPFLVRLPGANAGGTQDLGLVIDNVDREALDELERASGDPTTRIAATFRVYSSDDLTRPGSNPIALSISDVSAGMTRVEATATRTDILNKRFPAVLYDVARFPGLDR
jgi:hypothetical protein